MASEYQALDMLVAVSKRTADEGALRLTAQLMDVAPCPRCDFRKEFCRCEANSWFRSESNVS